MSFLHIVVVTQIVLLYLHNNLASSNNPFDDSILYTFKWPEQIQKDLITSEENIMKVVTKEREEYSCILPNVTYKEEGSSTSYEGGNGLELVSPLFVHTSCAYRFETYWTYEICHGKHVKQYHEERESKIVTTQEFYLGRWDLLTANDISEELTAKEKSPDYKAPVKKIEGLSLPYLQVNYTDGTLCDLNAKPRQTDVLYMCYEAGKHDFYSIKEIATCHYELIVLTSLLCPHPKYKPINTIEHEINCIGINGAPRKPKSFLKNEAQLLKGEIKNLNERINQKLQATLTLEVLTKDVKSDKGLEFQPIQAKSESQEIPDLSKLSKKSPSMKEFLSGEECVIGGDGYWKYEFCYGRYIEQFHVEKDNTKTTVRLGNFDYKDHKLWVFDNPFKVKKADSVTHFYGNGAVCETNIPRSVEVVFRCKFNKFLTMMTLKEPRMCSYVLEFESEMVCKLLPYADEYGIFKVPVH